MSGQTHTPEPSALEREVRFLDPAEVTIRRDRFGRLRLRLADGREFLDIHLSLAFPITHADRMLIVRDADLAEIGIIDNYLDTDEETRRILQEELAKAYFIPRITRVLSAKEEHGLLTLEVETDRGPRTIQVEYHHRVRVLPGGRVIMQDVDANRYEIPRLADLDPRSQALIDAYL